MIYSKFILLFLFVFTTIGVQAQLKLPSIFTSNMVLQRDAPVSIWGTAGKGDNIEIQCSWQDELISVKAGKDGKWKTKLTTTNSLDTQVITIKASGEVLKFENILFGEVWLCSGQSNMFQPLIGYSGQPTFGGQEAIVHSTNELLRIFSVNKEASEKPLDDFIGSQGWYVANPNTVSDFSAVAYFFGQQLQKILGCPVGLIHSSWGGTSIEPWMSKGAHKTLHKIDYDAIDFTKHRNQNPTALYNAMINPMVPYTIKGALWYQGESNRHNPLEYDELMPALVKDWRNKWESGQFPFYYVQIAPYNYDLPDAFDTISNTAYLREAQFKCLELIPNSGMAVTMDIGQERRIHPPWKKEVADRLLYQALNQTYGYSTIDFSGPVYDSLEVQDGGILLFFKHAENGFFIKDKLTGFEIAGEDKVFHSAKAKIKNYTNIYVWSDEVEKPVAVRYAWRNWVEGTLFDTNLLPASSFRTDNWELGSCERIILD